MEDLSMRGFDFAYKRNEEGYEMNGITPVKQFESAQLPEYQTKLSAGADFFAAEDVVVPSIWKSVFSALTRDLTLAFFPTDSNEVTDEEYVKEVNKKFSPTMIHTGVKASMQDDEVLYLYNRSSNPKKLGLILANSVGVIDADYFGNVDNDGEIMFAYFNFKPYATKIKVGDRIGQGVFTKCLRPEYGLRVKEAERVGGVGSTN